MATEKLWQPVVTLRRLELRGLESVRIHEDSPRPEGTGNVSVSRKGLKGIQGSKRSSAGGRSSPGKIKKRSKLQSVWLLPDGSVSFRKPQQKYSLRQPSLMVKQKIVTTRSNPGQSEGFVMPLWKPYSYEKKKLSCSKRKKRVPVKLDSILAQVQSNQVLDDDQVVQHLKVRKPEAMPQGKVTWTGIIKMMPKTYGASRRRLIKPIWKTPKRFFEGTVFEQIFRAPDRSEPAANSVAEQQGASSPESSNGHSSPDSSKGGSPSHSSSESSTSSSTAVRNLKRTYEEFRTKKAGELRKTTPSDMRKAEPQWVTKSQYKFLKNCNIVGSRTRISDGQAFYVAGSEYEPEGGTMVDGLFVPGIDPAGIDPDLCQFGNLNRPADPQVTKASNISWTSGDIPLKKNRSKLAPPSPDGSSVENHCPGDSIEVIDLF